jgi:hypothetical protein
VVCSHPTTVAHAASAACGQQATRADRTHPLHALLGQVLLSNQQVMHACIHASAGSSSSSSSRQRQRRTRRRLALVAGSQPQLWGWTFRHRNSRWLPPERRLQPACQARSALTHCPLHRCTGCRNICSICSRICGCSQCGRHLYHSMTQCFVARAEHAQPQEQNHRQAGHLMMRQDSPWPPAAAATAVVLHHPPSKPVSHDKGCVGPQALHTTQRAVGAV